MNDLVLTAGPVVSLDEPTWQLIKNLPYKNLATVDAGVGYVKAKWRCNNASVDCTWMRDVGSDLLTVEYRWFIDNESGSGRVTHYESRQPNKRFEELPIPKTVKELVKDLEEYRFDNSAEGRRAQEWEERKGETL